MSYGWDGEYDHGMRGDFHWSDYLPLRDSIDLKTAPINSDYMLVIGNKSMKLRQEPVHTGYCDFESRRCWVNAEVADIAADKRRPWIREYKAPEKEQFSATVYIAAHERAHARWTDYVMQDFEVRPTDGFQAPVTAKKGASKNVAFDRLLHTVANILEDERIERLIERDFKYLRGYLRVGAKSFLRVVPQKEDFVHAGVINGTPVPHDPDDPNLVLTWVLRRRVLNRAGVREKCPLSPTNKARLKLITPLLKEAFHAQTFRRVVEISREIIKLLEIREYNESIMEMIQQVLSKMGGSRSPSDKSKSASSGESGDGGTVSRDISTGKPRPGRGENQESKGSADGPPDDQGEGITDSGQGLGRDDRRQESGSRDGGSEHEDREAQAEQDADPDAVSGSGDGDAQRDAEAKNAEEEAESKMSSSGYTDASNTMKKRKHRTSAAPYEVLQRSIQPFLNGMAALFRFEKTRPGVDYERSGSRLDVRRAMRNSVEPFRTATPPQRHGKIAVRVVIDESGSMSGKKEWEAKRVATLFYEALRHRHDVAIALAPDGGLLVDQRDGEIGKGFIAGYGSNSGTSFNEVMGRELEMVKNDRVSTVKYVLLVADGESGDRDGKECKRLVQKYAKHGIRCMGVGLCLTTYGDEFFRDIFGDFYVSIQDANELLPKMARILKVLAQRAQNRRGG